MEAGARGHTVGRKSKEEGGMREYLPKYLSYHAPSSIPSSHHKISIFAHESLPVTWLHIITIFVVTA
jgi:hypothetical protein